ncbi:NCA2-domain-containing protein [Acaromyces ingoldii]|uniref:NCA2-domain-containing protein n=1 Tax=Acaromyces ingoldii TaxID=215250 RepID=A0A316YKC2_9BASI|nr:NCA2-domain-containing protein [Acaromyces ingoldii]PWN89877.1 NCA2-domain-containing protein [Acaromyces ingoldii]
MSGESSHEPASYALESIRHLGNRLDAIEAAQRARADEGIVTTTARAAPDARDAFDDIASSVNLDLAQAKHVPQLESLQGSLRALQEAKSTGQVRGAGDHDEAAELLAVAKVTYASYGIVLDALLRDAERVNDQAWYWTEVEEDPTRTVTYLIQTLPSRIVNLVRMTISVLSETATNGMATTQDVAQRRRPVSIDGETLKRALQLLRSSPNHVVGALFPLAVDSSAAPSSPFRSGMLQAQGADQEQEHGETGKPQKKKGGLPTSLLVSRARAFSPLGLTRHEARTKRSHLMRERDTMAEKLGALALAMRADQPHSPPGSQVGDTSGVAIASIGANLDALREELRKRIQDLQKAVALAGGPDEAAELSLSSLATADGMARSLDGILTRSFTTRQAYVASLLSPSPVGLGVPSRLARLWPTLVLTPLTILVGGRLIVQSWDTIVAKAYESRETVRAFFVNWVYEPCIKLLDTIRHGDDQEGIIMTRESLNSDLRSLERMVTSFAQEKYHLQGAELEAVATKVREGDLTNVLKIYEDEMRSPLRSAVGGSLIRSLLIQIQKVKVDIAVAMRGVDQLLKSQQLLFGAIGIAPAMAILYVVTNYTKERVSIALGRKGKDASLGTRFRAWEAMRRIDRLLAGEGDEGEQQAGGDQDVSALTQGLLLLDLATLRRASPTLLASVSKGRKATAKRLRRQLLQDIRDLEQGGGSGKGANVGSAVGLSWLRRRAAVDRMWKSWGGILSLPM